MDTLCEEVGYPYTQIPTEMMIYGRSGLANTHSLCGAINGASAAITLVSGKDNYTKPDQ